MSNPSVHVGKSINLSGIVLFAHFDAANPANNVIDTGTPLNVSCPSGACRVGVLPASQGGDGRTIFVDGITATTSPTNVALGALGAVGGILVSVVPANAAPSAFDVTGIVSSAEYDTPASRPSS